MNKPSTYVGQFLRSLREQRGFENIHEYVRQYQLPVSYVYYTELESGKKRIAQETAKQLCAALKTDSLSFFYHLLKDILPTDIQPDFLDLIPVQISDKSEQAGKTQKVIESYQKLQLSMLGLDLGRMTNEAEDYISENSHLMPLVAIIYCVPSMTNTELSRTVQRLGIATPVEEIISKFAELGILTVTENPANGTKTISRCYDIIVTKDQRIVSKRISAETEMTIAENSHLSIGGPNGSSCFFGIVGLSKKRQEELIAQIADIDTEFKAYHDAESTEAPQLMTLHMSPAKEYSN